MTSSGDRLLLRVEEVAEQLCIGRTKVFELIRSGELRSVKLGGARRVSATAVRAYIAKLEGGDLS
jgi:excisionase family DNA binding protein